MSEATLNFPIANLGASERDSSDKRAVALRQIRKAENTLVDLKHHHYQQNIKSAIHEIIELKKEGVIDDDAFSDLIEKVAARFIEAEVDFQVSTALEKLFSQTKFIFTTEKKHGW